MYFAVLKNVCLNLHHAGSAASTHGKITSIGILEIFLLITVFSLQNRVISKYHKRYDSFFLPVMESSSHHIESSGKYHIPYCTKSSDLQTLIQHILQNVSFYRITGLIPNIVGVIRKCEEIIHCLFGKIKQCLHGTKEFLWIYSYMIMYPITGLFAEYTYYFVTRFGKRSMRW